MVKGAYLQTCQPKVKSLAPTQSWTQSVTCVCDPVCPCGNEKQSQENLEAHGPVILVHVAAKQ